MRDERPNTTGHPHTLPTEKPSIDKSDRALVASGEGNIQVGGDVSRANRDLYTSKGDLHVHFQGGSSSQPARAPLTAPAPPPHFTGRKETLDELTKRLLSGENVGLSALQGMGGIGKTAVAKKLAEQLQDNHAEAFPGGVLWSELGPAPDVLTVLDVWARNARPGSDLSSVLDPRSRADAVRQLLAGHGRFCAFLDDVWDAEPVRLLSQALPPGCPLLLTTRLGDLARRLGCTPLRLDRLDPKEGLDLITKHLGGGDLAAFETETRRVLRLTEALPLAIEIAIGLIDEPSELPELAADLARRPRIEVLTQGEVREESIEVCFSLSYERLDSDDQRRFRALGAFADAPFDGAAVAALWGEDEVDTAKLRFLSRRNLLHRSSSSETLRLHGLLKAYACMLLEKEGETEETRGRHAEHYRSLAVSAPWQTTEAAYDQVRHGWNHVESHPEASVAYALSCVDFQSTRGHWKDRERWLRTAFVLAQPEDNLDTRAQILHALGLVCSDLGRKEEALRRFEQALELRREVGDRRGEGKTLSSIALVYSDLGRKNQALRRFRQALEVLRETGDGRGEGAALNNIAMVYSDLGREEEALRRFEQALEVLREVRNRPGEGATLNNIAKVYTDLGRKEEALRRFEQALEVLREVGDRRGEGTTLHNIAGVYDSLGRKEEALRRFEQALEVLHEVGNGWFEAMGLANYARALSSGGHLLEATKALEACVALEEALGHPNLERDRSFLEQVRKELVESGDSS